MFWFNRIVVDEVIGVLGIRYVDVFEVVEIVVVDSRLGDICSFGIFFELLNVFC